MSRCQATTKAGNPCSRQALTGEDYCLFHSQSEYAVAKREAGRKAGGYGKGKQKVAVGDDRFNGHKLVTLINGEDRLTTCANCKATLFDTPCPRPNAFPDQPYELEINVVHVKPYPPDWKPIDWKQSQAVVEAKQTKEVATMTERVEERGPSHLDQLVSSLDVEGIMQIDGWWRSEIYRYNPEHEPIYELYSDDIYRWKDKGLAPIPPAILNSWPPANDKGRRRAIDGMRQAIMDKRAERDADPTFKAMEKPLTKFLDDGGVL